MTVRARFLRRKIIAFLSLAHARVRFNLALVDCLNQWRNSLQLIQAALNFVLEDNLELPEVELLLAMPSLA